MIVITNVQARLLYSFIRSSVRNFYKLGAEVRPVHIQFLKAWMLCASVV